MSTIPPDPSRPDPADPFAAAAAPVPPAAAGGPPTGDAPAPEKSSPGWKAWIAAGAVAAVLAVGAGALIGSNDSGSSSTTAAAAAQTAGGVGANGQAAGFPGGGTSGTVTANDGSTLTVESSDGSTVTVETTADTTVIETVEGSASDLEVGDNVLVMGETDDDGNVTAANVVDNGDMESTMGAPDGGPPSGSGDGSDASGMPSGTPPEGMEPPVGMTAPGGGMGRPTSGQITAVDGDTITVETTDGETVTVTLADDTTVSVAEEIEVADVAEGETVSVMGEAADDVVTATTIRVGELGAGPMGGGMPGGPGASTDDATSTTTT